MNDIAATGLDDQAVTDYLRTHPDFFARHPALLGELELPHETGSAISLIERQVGILRERNMSMRRRLNDLLQAARDNDTLFAKTRSLTLSLLDITGWHELNEVLATNMLIDFEADFVCCHLRGATLNLDHIIGHPQVLPSDRFVSGGNAGCVALREEEMQALFPQQDARTPGSVVFIPFVEHAVQGCLTVGSRDIGRFSADMETLFVRYIGDVLARTVARL